MKQKKNGDKKIIVSLVAVLLLYVIVIGALAVDGQKNASNSYEALNDKSNISSKNKEIISKDTSKAPFIEKILLNKEKYRLGDDMKIISEVEGAKNVKAFIENEKGYHEVILSLNNREREKQTWMGTWMVTDSLDMKEYNLKIVASNDFGFSEKITRWLDPLPNPGHYLSTIDADVDLNMAGKNIINAKNLPQLKIVDSYYS